MIARNPITLNGKSMLEKRLEDLRIEQTKTIEEISEARKKGDLSENFEYHAAKRRNNEISGAIAKLEDYLRTAITPRILTNPEMACFGAKVQLKKNSETVDYVIVGDLEADPDRGSISINSALAQSILGRKVGHKFDINGTSYEITEITSSTEEELKNRIAEIIKS